MDLTWTSRPCIQGKARPRCRHVVGEMRSGSWEGPTPDREAPERTRREGMGGNWLALDALRQRAREMGSSGLPWLQPTVSVQGWGCLFVPPLGSI